MIFNIFLNLLIFIFISYVENVAAFWPHQPTHDGNINVQNIIWRNTLWHLTVSQLSINTTQSWIWIVREGNTTECHWWESVHVCSFLLLLTRLPMTKNKEVASKLFHSMGTKIIQIFNTCSHRHLNPLAFKYFDLECIWWRLSQKWVVYTESDTYDFITLLEQ